MTEWVLESCILAPALLPFAGAVCLHIVANRLWPRASLWTLLFGPLAAGALLCALWMGLREVHIHEPGGIAQTLPALAVYIALTYAYTDLYGFNQTSIRLQALRAIKNSGGTATRAELVEACGSETTASRRIEQYAGTGELALVDGRYRMARRRILYITRGFRIARHLLLGKRRSIM